MRVGFGAWVRWALGRGANWRYFLLFAIGMLVPAALAFVPVWSFSRWLFDFSPRAEELTRALDAGALLDALQQLGEPAAGGIRSGFVGAFLVAAVVAPALAALAVALARKSAPLDVRSLLAEAGELYPRMVRMAIASIVPLGIAAGGAAAAFHFADKAGERATLESAASHATTAANVSAAFLFWLAVATIEAGRAHFAAEPGRKSAFMAWLGGVGVTFRHPARVLGLSFVTTLIAVGLAAIVTGIRFRIPQTGLGSIALAFALGQLAVTALAWGRASRLAGLAELIRTESRG